MRLTPLLIAALLAAAVAARGKAVPSSSGTHHHAAATRSRLGEKAAAKATEEVLPGLENEGGGQPQGTKSNDNAVSKNAAETHEFPVHKLNEADVLRSRTYQGKMNESVSREGVKEPAKYVEIKGKAYAVNRKYHLRAARPVGQKAVPAQKMTLPHLGYKSEHDVLGGGR